MKTLKKTLSILLPSLDLQQILRCQVHIPLNDLRKNHAADRSPFIYSYMAIQGLGGALVLEGLSCNYLITLRPVGWLGCCGVCVWIGANCGETVSSVYLGQSTKQSSTRIVITNIYRKPWGFSERIMSVKRNYHKPSYGARKTD